MRQSAPGFFISFEGGEGAGKTTQIKRLKSRLEEFGYDVILTREPGGTPEAEKIRDLLVQRDGGSWDGLTEILLFYAARRHHVETLIKPALAKGQVVITDRFSDSTHAYQCFGHGVSEEKLLDVDRLVLDGFKPDITFLLDIDVKEGLKRSHEANAENQSETEDRFERLDLSFHENLRSGFLKIADQNKHRFVVINALQNMDDISVQISDEALNRIKENK